jgi:hypothetical protein
MHIVGIVNKEYINFSKLVHKVKQSHYTPWKLLGGGGDRKGSRDYIYSEPTIHVEEP